MTDPMSNDTWQHLLGLESVDVVCEWHRQVHDRQLNTRRASEIVSSAKQAREYFRNSANSAHTVRPLLTFYGIASLARAALLLLKPGSGEESLTRGHGLETVDWSNTLSGELPSALVAIGSLKVRTSAGLFNDLLTQTGNRICIHVRSSAVDWGLNYELPPLGTELTLETLLAILPDLHKLLPRTAHGSSHAIVNEMTYSDAGGFLATVSSKQFEALRDSYMELGYEVVQTGEVSQVKCSSQNFQASIPQFMHTYVDKMFGTIPRLYIVKPVQRSTRISQLGITYMLSYFLGMLTRYFPTHWIALHGGAKGDGLWPAIHATQTYVEQAFPELTIELVHDMLIEREAP